MPELKWIGKEQVINHDKEVPFRLLKLKKKLSAGEDSENLLIHGDNLEALKALMPFYYNKVKCIYIDPPYNTGNERWTYNDNVNSPEIKKWLGKVVGSEGKDLNRHDKWLCMMYPRLKLLYDLLDNNGYIFISIDENELPNLLNICDEIFSRNNQCGIFIWQKKYGGGNDAGQIAIEHEYIVCYSKTKLGEEWLEPHFQDYLKRYKEKDKKGRYFWDTLERPGLRNPIDVIVKFENKNYKLKTFRSQRRVNKDLKSGEIKILKLGSKISFQFKQRLKEGKKPRSILHDKKETIKKEGLFKVGSNAYAKNELRELFDKDIFENPKPTTLIKYLFRLTGSKDGVFLDSFAGSGTTGQAVLELNKEDIGSRKFILVEMEDKICKEVTAERLKRVIQGYSYKKSNGKEVRVEGLEGSFKFMELGNPLFDKYGQIIGKPTYQQLGSYIYFTETREFLKGNKIQDWYLGTKGGIHYFLIYKEKRNNKLNHDFIDIAKKYEGKKIIYADICLIDEETLERYNIEFKQIPYELKKF